MYQYPRLEGAGSIIASRSFYRADNVKFSWNKKGICSPQRNLVIVVTCITSLTASPPYLSHPPTTYPSPFLPCPSLLSGSAVLVVTSTDVDKTGASYYGEQGLLYLSARGDGNLVILDKKGPIYDVQWSPNSEEFCVLYGCIPQ